jgi:hypothetical protein
MSLLAPPLAPDVNKVQPTNTSFGTISDSAVCTTYIDILHFGLKPTTFMATYLSFSVDLYGKGNREERKIRFVK